MSAALLTDRSESKVEPTSVASSETGYLAPVLPIRRPAPAGPARRPVTRRAGSRGPRYLQGSAPAHLQLSRRGELVLRRVTALVTAVVVVLVVLAGVFALVRAVGSSPAQTRSISVQSGQSLWQIAAQTAPGADVGDTVNEIRSLNHLSDSALTPGQTLLVPVAR